MRCEFGYCLHCEKEISSACTGCGSRKVNTQYTEVCLPMTNGSKMVVGVCLDCRDSVFQADKAALMEAVKAAWLKGFEKNHTPLEVVNHHKDSVKDLAFA